MKALFYDTETTGLPLFSEPSEDPRQPHIVQLAAILVDLDTRKQLSSIDLTIAPDRVGDPGRRREDPQRHDGLRPRSRRARTARAAALPRALESRGRCASATTSQFDARIVRIGLHRYAHLTERAPLAGRRADPSARRRSRRRSSSSRRPRRCCAANFNRHKSANLREAYLHFTGQELVDAHSAIADAKACLQVYLRDQGREGGRVSTTVESAERMALRGILLLFVEVQNLARQAGPTVAEADPFQTLDAIDDLVESEPARELVQLARAALEYPATLVPACDHMNCCINVDTRQIATCTRCGGEVPPQKPLVALPAAAALTHD
jgi:DNA polymerase-3 subunit epsilon